MPLQSGYRQDAPHAIKANLHSERRVDGMPISSKTFYDNMSGVRVEYAKCDVPVRLYYRSLVDSR